MSESLKFIVAELNKEPFNKGYSLISFDSLEPLQLLQILTDVLTEIEPKQKVDVREEAADQTAIRIFSILKVLKYRPPSDPESLNSFRQGIVQGDKHTVHPVIEWLLRRLPELKERAYLARYLVKVDIPADFLADAKIAELHEQYENYIKSFMEVHKQLTQLKNSGFSTADIKKDIASMEDEKDQLVKRIERLKRKVASAPNSEPMLAVARNLRSERDREITIQHQKHEQKNLMITLDQRIQRLQQQMKDAKQAAIGTTPTGLLQNLEEETRINTYLVKEKVPNEIADKKRAIQELQKVVLEPAMGQADLDAILLKIRETNSEMNKLVEKRMMTSDPADDKVSGVNLYRQQASIVHNKKDSVAEDLRHAREELHKVECECDEKREKLQAVGGGEEVLKGEEFKKYVNKLRTKSTGYKKKRQELSEMRAETGVLARTEEVLSKKIEDMNKTQSMYEARKGVSGFRETQDALENVSSMKSEFDDMKGRTLEDISRMVQQLNTRIEKKKSILAPVIKELRPLRQQAQELTMEHKEKKSAYDSLSAGLESNRSKLEQEVHGYREEISSEESRYHYLNNMLRVLEAHQQRVTDEMKSYTSNDPNEKKKSFREQMTKKIQEQENLGKALREKQKNLRDNQETNVKQVKMWRDVERLLLIKQKLASGDNSRSFEEPVYNSRPSEDRLIL